MFLCLALLLFVLGAAKSSPNCAQTLKFPCSTGNIYVDVVPAATVHQVTNDANEVTCNVSVAMQGYPQTAAVYAISQNTDDWRLVDLFNISTLPSGIPPCTNATPDVVWAPWDPANAGKSSPLVATLHTGGHGFAYWAIRNASEASGRPGVTIEDVIASNGSLEIRDIYEKYGIETNDFWQDEPLPSFYCIYRHRPGEAGIIPDCPNITETLEMTAKLLTDAGVHTVFTDSTNLGTFSPQSDVIQARPNEVLFEEWAALRRRGVPAPAIATWQACQTGSNLWERDLELYNNASYSDLVLRDPRTQKKVFPFPWKPGPPGSTKGKPDPAIVAKVLNNGGREDVLGVDVWANFGESEAQDGIWTFMSPCYTGNAPGVGNETTGVAGKGIAPCEQLLTKNSSMGSQMSADPSFQLGYSSLVYEAAGKFQGMTFKRQFATVIRERPSNLFLSDWNCFKALGKTDPVPESTGYAMGLGLPPDPLRRIGFVDTYGASVGRDISPSRASGSLYYDLARSCLRVLRVTSYVAGWDGQKTSSSSSFSGRNNYKNESDNHPKKYSQLPSPCPIANESCCTLDPTADLWQNVWAFQKTNGTTDHLLTSSSVEANQLRKNRNWTEMCTPYPANADFCTKPSIRNTTQSFMGPFVLQTPQSAPLPKTALLIRCHDPNTTRHSFAIDNCPPPYNNEMQLGLVSLKKSSNTPRALVRCSQDNIDFHILDAPCPSDAAATILGFVH